MLGRTPSTRIQDPTRRPSHTSSKPYLHRGASTKAEKPQRPELQRRGTTVSTRYIDMLLGLDHVSPFHNILASLSVWILLAGYIVFPATFNKLQKETYDEKADTDLKKHALNTVRNVPLLYVAAFACGLGVAGCLWLWWKTLEELCLGHQSHLPSCVAELNRWTGIDSSQHLLCSRW